MVIVPNNKISNETIENISQEKFRRVDRNIYISNDMGYEKLNVAVDVINNVFSSMEVVEVYNVGLNNFNEFSSL